MSKIVKWGFGMAPFKKETLYTYKNALNKVELFISNSLINLDTNICEEISTVKGLFNRIIRQDQWDWFTVNMYFDYPPIGLCDKIAKKLADLRVATKDNSENNINTCKMKLVGLGLVNYCHNFLNYNPSYETDEEYLYILSRREENEILKIGMTTRDIGRRVKEINNSTGVLYPFSARKIYKVNDCKKAEKLVHSMLNEYRIRDDREFFLLPFNKACVLIDECLKNNDLLYYKSL